MSNIRTANEWEETLKLWETSSESQASFCRKNNIPFSTFQYHLQKEKKNDILFEKIKLFEKYRFGRSSEKWTEEDKAQLILLTEQNLQQMKMRKKPKR